MKTSTPVNIGIPEGNEILPTHSIVATPSVDITPVISDLDFIVVPITKILENPKYLVREKLNPKTIDRYIEFMQADNGKGKSDFHLDAIQKDGKLMLIGGGHTKAALEKMNETTALVRVWSDLTDAEAIVEAARLNRHGLPMSAADKWLTLTNLHKEPGVWSIPSREIARRLGFSHTLVNKFRKETKDLSGNGFQMGEANETLTVKRGNQTYVANKPKKKKNLPAKEDKTDTKTEAPVAGQTPATPLKTLSSNGGNESDSSHTENSQTSPVPNGKKTRISGFKPIKILASECFKADNVAPANVNGNINKAVDNAIYDSGYSDILTVVIGGPSQTALEDFSGRIVEVLPPLVDLTPPKEKVEIPPFSLGELTDPAPQLMDQIDKMAKSLAALIAKARNQHGYRLMKNPRQWTSVIELSLLIRPIVSLEYVNNTLVAYLSCQSEPKSGGEICEAFPQSWYKAINYNINRLIKLKNKFDRFGKGGSGDPFRYKLKNQKSDSGWLSMDVEAKGKLAEIIPTSEDLLREEDHAPLVTTEAEVK